MDRSGFEELTRRLGDAWNAGDALGAAACFAEVVDYADPRRYRFGSRDELTGFFEPGPGGHRIEWHRCLFDEAFQTGVVEYTYHGHHRYHGAAIVEIDTAGRIRRWREWQHRDDEADWEGYLAGPPSSARSP